LSGHFVKQRFLRQKEGRIEHAAVDFKLNCPSSSSPTEQAPYNECGAVASESTQTNGARKKEIREETQAGEHSAEERARSEDCADDWSRRSAEEEDSFDQAGGCGEGFAGDETVAGQRKKQGDSD